MGHKLQKGFMKRDSKRQIKNSLEFKRELRKNRNKLCVKWKGCNNSFNSLIDKKDIVI